jgi:hypothetical protein
MWISVVSVRLPEVGFKVSMRIPKSTISEEILHAVQGFVMGSRKGQSIAMHDGKSKRWSDVIG